MILENEKLARLRAREEEAWGEFHRDHYPRLWNSVNRILDNASQTDDVVQEAFVKAYRQIDHFKGQSQLGTWLYRIGINQALDFQRKQRRRERWISFFSPLPSEDEKVKPLPEFPVPAASSLGLENADLKEQLQAAISELSAEHRAVVQLRLIDEISLAETAKLLRCKEGTVNSRLHYACEYLRKKLQNKMENPP